MAKEIMQRPPTSDTAERHSTTGTNVPLFEAVVFKRLPPTADFSCSLQILLPGQHAAAGAWSAVHAALRAPDGGELIGGEIRRVALAG